MNYYHILKSLQKNKLTLNIIIFITFSYKPCHHFLACCITSFSETDLYKGHINKMYEIILQIMLVDIDYQCQ